VVTRLTAGIPWTVLCVNTDRPMFWLLARDNYGSVEELKGRRIGIHPRQSASSAASCSGGTGSILTMTSSRSP
jgi:NitT/TauT family transport system substrate-binding protein